MTPGSAAARIYGRVFAALLIAATAPANGLPLYTRNPADFAGLQPIVTVKAV